ncbi:transcription factor Zelda [Culicoides brevitarsis]|uniref:transcription factor Zelda n=1 Tax=Culicoides brevitarsis TaxID=469753 RepID=UPI00307BC9D7
MASNGGTLHGGPQITNGHFSCTHCGTYFDSSSSLQVHMHYHHQQQQQQNATGQDVTHQQARWPGIVTNNSASSTPTTPTEEHNNNQPSVKNHIKSSSPLVQAAADSQSDNNQESSQNNNNNNNSQVTPVSDSNNSSLVFNNTNSTSSNSASPLPYQSQQQAQEMHPYPPHYIGYEQYYHPHNIDYGAPLPPPPLPQHHQLPHHTQSLGAIPSQQQQQQQEYKTVPSTRYHPYSSSQHSSITQLSKHGLSPKVVSSSGGNSPLEGQAFDQDIPPGQPTPSPSPKQCDKCGMVCDTPGQMAEHHARAHPETTRDESEQTQSYPTFSNSYVKEEPSSDILDLDSQKMVYPPQHGMAPMHPGGLHPLQSMQRHPMVWGHEMHPGFMATHQPGFKAPDYPPTPPQQTPSAHIKSEYHIPSATQLGKNFEGIPPTGGIENALPTSPQDFPSTTTPQETANGFRSFETPSSSLSAGTPKSTAWKSNEARRPKTYNCTACNKWFTSSGHLKRHYNTTLHKNAVKSSGQPDPALTPISHHHHPNRDPNYTGKSRRAAQAAAVASQNQMQQVGLDQRSPEYTPNQFALPSLNQGFQQYGGNPHHASTINGSLSQQGNGVADRIIQASTESGLQMNFSENTQMMAKVLDNQQLQPSQQQEDQQQHHTIIINSSLGPETTMGHYNIQHINHLGINTNIQSYQVTQSEAQNYHHIIGNDNHRQQSMDDNSEGQHQQQQQDVFTYYQSDSQYDDSPDEQKPIAAYTRMQNVTSSLYQGDMPPPFSPDVPQADQIYTLTSTQMAQIDRSMTPLQAAIAPSTSPPAPYSPSVTSTNSFPIQNTQISASQSDNGEYKCLQCEKAFNKICYLTQHNKTFHSGEKPYKCTRCGKRFACEQSSEEHFAKHAGEKPFKCEICPKQFNHKTDLRRHMCIHTGSKPYCCAQCGKGFIRKDHMLKHTETHKKRETMLANRKANKTNKQIKKVQMYDTNTSGSDISTISSTGSCKNEQIHLMI